MKCNRCDYPGELEWPENWHKGMLPIDSVTGYEHKCDDIIRYVCSNCTNTIHQELAKFTKRELCSICQSERFRN